MEQTKREGILPQLFNHVFSYRISHIYNVTIARIQMLSVSTLSHSTILHKTRMNERDVFIATHRPHSARVFFST